MGKVSFHAVATATLVSLFLMAGTSWPAPLEAKAVYVEGSVAAVSIVDAKMRRVAKGDIFVEGDRITTSSSGVVEVEFDTGDLIRVDKGSDLIIKTLNRNSRGSTFSIFSLMIGRVKSAVVKLVDSDSKFEYHTKAAICGVSGTPPFIVEATDGQTYLDLLGEPDEEGAVYVRGFDPAETMVTVFSGSRTIAHFGSPPLFPFPISQERLIQLNRAIPFRAVPKARSEPGATKGGEIPKEDMTREKPGANKGQQESGGANDTGTGAPDAGFGNSIGKITLENLSSSVSVPKVTEPGESGDHAEVEQLGNQKQGVIGDQTSTSGAVELPPVALPVRVHIRLR